jgi:NADH:ubiquinone oxidoreductase subunit 2 (subunit N)
VALAIGAALNTAVSLQYYIRIVRAMFIDEPESAARETPAHRVQLGATGFGLTSRKAPSDSASG